MEQLMYDENLTIIKAFQSYLSDVIDKGYNNDYKTLLYIVKHIKNLRDELIEDNNYDNNHNYHNNMDYMDENDDDLGRYNLSDTNSPNHSVNNSRSNSPNIFQIMSQNNFDNNTETEDETEDEDKEDEEIKQRREKEYNKIHKFIDGSDLSNIYLYKKNNNYIKNMESFIKKSYLY